jgi:hypothetical protein
VGCSELVADDQAFLWVIKDFEAYIVTASEETPSEQDSTKKSKKKKVQPTTEGPTDRVSAMN